MLINTHIGFDDTDGQGIDGSLFQRELLELDSLGKKRIQIHINSPGGSVIDGYNIYSAILESKTPVDTYNVGIAASTAGWLFAAGRKRVMSDYASLMMHPPMGGDNKQLQTFTDSIATMLSSKSNCTKDQVIQYMKATTWMNADDALAKGFATEVSITSEKNRKYMSNAGDVKAKHKIAVAIYNNALRDETKISMIKVTNKLGLNDGANEEQIVAAITAVENKAVKAESELKDVQNKLTAAETKNSDLQKEVDALKAEKEAINAAKEAAEKEAKASDCKNMLDAFVKSGRITQESVNQWTETANAVGNDKVKAMIEALPVNKAAAKIENKPNELPKDATPTSAVHLMAKIQAKNKK